MTCEDIYNIIKDNTGIDIKTKDRKRETSYLKKSFYALCFMYTDEYITNENLIKFTNCKSHSSVSLAIMEIDDLIKFDAEFSKNFEYLDKLISSKTKKRERYKGEVTGDYLKLVNNLKKLQETNIKLYSFKFDADRKIKYYKERYKKVNYKLNKLKQKKNIYI